MRRNFRIHFSLFLILCSMVLIIGGCSSSNKETASSSSSKSPTIVGSTKVGATKDSTSETQTVESSKTESESTQNTSQSSSDKANSSSLINLDEIKQGNYSSLEGNWKEIKYGANYQNGKGIVFDNGGNDSLDITGNTITNNNGKMSVTNQSLKDQNGEHEVVIDKSDNNLKISLADETVPINWAVTIFPKGSTSDYKLNEGSATNEVPIIVVWTSNNSYTQVFAKDDGQTQIPASQPAKNDSSSLDVNKISSNDFSSLAGTWQSQDGKVITVSNQIQQKPQGSNAAFDQGVVIDSNGHSEVIAAGQIIDGYMTGSIGTFGSAQSITSFAPLLIIPKGVQASQSDDSDSGQDRLIVGGGQGGYQASAYYRK